ncbi:uncharacterized protein LOC132567096 [Heteronotia binoei]|uniref:uncharacterized protein LOC132567096 n=1 Tax=Heteronotia binoei TaxID=13085 RepID=UPI00292F0CC2|nr:uncharacterized protein LOC132567096 [Heteronotia binoei]
MLKCWPAVKAYFQKLGEDHCPPLIWRHIDNEAGEKDYSTSQTYMMFLQTTLTPIEETVLILEQDALTAPELFEAMLRLLNSLKQRKADSFFGTETDKALRKMPPSKARKVTQDFLKFFEKTIAYLEAKFDFSEKNHLCALTPFSLKKSVTYDHLRCAAEQLKMEKIINLDNLYSEYTDAKSLMDEQVACVDPKITVDKKWVAIFSEMGTRSHKCENLLLLVSKILSIPCSNAFVERVFSLMSARWTETRNRCNVDLVKAELQVKVNFDMDCEQFYHRIIGMPESPAQSFGYVLESSQQRCCCTEDKLHSGN